jgi:hypothetical protein
MTGAMWLLCLSVAVALPTSGRLAGFWALLAGCLAVLLLTNWLPPSIAGLGLLAGIAAVWQLLRPSTGLVPNLICGMLAGCGAFLHSTLGAPLWAAAGLALVVGGFATWRAQTDPQFAPVTLRSQALRVAGLVSPLLAACPGLKAGWQSALALNQNLQEGTASATPSWVWQLLALALAIGIVHGLVVRR